MIQTVRLPAAVAAKLFEIRATADPALVRACELYLHDAALTGDVVASAPPAFFSGGGGVDELLPRIDKLRSQVAVLSRRIDAALQMATDATSLLDLRDDPEFGALLSHRLRLERQEEATLSTALAKGIIIERRPDCDPRAVLEIAEAAIDFAEVA